MQVYDNFWPNMIEKSSCALGMFDGVHVGHKIVLNNAIEYAKESNSKSVAVTFAVHPQVVTSNTPTNQITTLEDRLGLFECLGIDIALVLKFDKSFAKISANDYVNIILVGALHSQHITIGYDHRFGRAKQGNEELLDELSNVYNYKLHVIPPVSIDGQIVSSSIIRKMIHYGDIFTTNKLLGRPFILKGKVIHGAKRGRILGFPTANINPPNDIIIPGCGVYEAEIKIEGYTKIYRTVVNVGFRPTFADINTPSIEAYIIDFDQNIYDKEVCISFKSKIRNEKKFTNSKDLIKQIQQDIQSITRN